MSFKFSNNNPRYKGGKIELICNVCNNKFYVYTSYNNAKYCSQKCCHESQKVKKVCKICRFCDNKFYVYPSQMNSKYCSNICKNKSLIKNKFILECNICNKKFEVISSQINSKYCSQVCRIKSFYGKTNPNWKNGISFEPYCYKFNEKTKNEIRKRDNYQCQMPKCLYTQLENLILYNKSLSVHHIHYKKEDCYPDLIALCTKCNCIVNSNRNYWEELFMKILRKRGLCKS